MNGEILKVMDSPRNALKLVLIGQCNGSFPTYLYPENLFLQFNIFSYFALHSFAYYSFYVGKGIPELKKNCPIMFAVNI